MKFCMVTTFYPPYHFGGDGTYVRALSEALVARGHEVTVVHCEDAYRLQAGPAVVREPEPGAVRVHRIKKKSGFLSPLVTQQLGIPGLKAGQLREVFAAGFDVVNFHNISLVGGPGVIALSKAPVNLYTLHEHWLLCATHIFWKNRSHACDSRQCIRCSLRSGIPPQWWRYTPLLERSLRRIDRFISPSRYTADRHRDILGIAAPIDVVPLFSGLDPGAAIPGAGEGGLEFLYVGRMTAAKGVAELLSSFAGWPDYRLTLIGEGEQLEELRRGYADCANIQFLGGLPQGELVRHYQRSCAVILPSLAPETFGLTVVEGFACATPAIVRSAGGNRETIDSSGAGFVYRNEVELFEALESFARDPGLRERLGRKARAAYEALYTAEKHVARYLEIAGEALEAKASSRRLGQSR